MGCVEISVFRDHSTVTVAPPATTLTNDNALGTDSEVAETDPTTSEACEMGGAVVTVATIAGDCVLSGIVVTTAAISGFSVLGGAV